MAKPRSKIRHAKIVELFAARLRELRFSRGLTQADLARKAHVATSYIGRLEAGSAAPGIDLVERLAEALGTTLHDLLPTAAPAEPVPLLQEQAKKLFESILGTADREMLLMLCPLLARLGESPTRKR